MEQELVRMCSAEEASVLAHAAGRCVRVGAARVCICHPTGRRPIDTASPVRYLARIELLNGGGASPGPAGPAAAAVVTDLFGP